VNYQIDANAIKGASLQARHISGLTVPKVSLQLNSPCKVIHGFEVGYKNFFGSYEQAAFFKYGGIRVGFDSLDDKKRRVEYLEFLLNISP
jgi:hypothetical protein